MKFLRESALVAFFCSFSLASYAQVGSAASDLKEIGVTSRQISHTLRSMDPHAIQSMTDTINERGMENVQRDTREAIAGTGPLLPGNFYTIRQIVGARGKDCVAVYADAYLVFQETNPCPGHSGESCDPMKLYFCDLSLTPSSAEELKGRDDVLMVTGAAGNPSNSQVRINLEVCGVDGVQNRFKLLSILLRLLI